jgi:hypothetical protein
MENEGALNGIIGHFLQELFFFIEGAGISQAPHPEGSVAVVKAPGLHQKILLIVPISGFFLL